MFQETCEHLESWQSSSHRNCAGVSNCSWEREQQGRPTWWTIAWEAERDGLLKALCVQQRPYNDGIWGREGSEV